MGKSIMVEANITESGSVSEEINICVRIVPILVHMIGLYTLHYLRKRKQVTHLKLIEHLSVSELALVLASFLISVLNLTLRDRRSSRDNETTIFVLVLVKNTGLSLVYYFMNIFIMLDRLAEMKLHIKYPQYVTHSVVNATLAVLWLSAIVFTIASVYHCLNNPDFDHVKFVYLYFFPLMEALFLVVAIVTYTYIIKQYVRLKTKINKHEVPKTGGESRKIAVIESTSCPQQQAQPQQHQKRRKSMMMTKSLKLKYLFSKRSPLLMISLLVLTFIFFMVLPDAINFHYYVTTELYHVKEKLPWSIVLSTYILYTFAYTSDGLIYVFLQRDARKMLLKKLNRRRHIVSASILTWTTGK